MTISVVDGSIDGPGGRIPIRDYLPGSRSGKRPFVWLHGGGFTAGGLDQRESDAPARALAATGRPVRAVDYRLAPAVMPWARVRTGVLPGRFPAAHDDVVEVVAAIVEESGGPVHLGGASAGANIAAGVALALRDRHAAQLRSLVLAYGVLHAALPDSDAIEQELSGPIARWAFGRSMVHRMALNYVGEESALRPGYAFPGGADLQGLPSALVLDARNDRLRRSGAAFADELRAAGIEVAQHTVPAMHGFLGAPKRPAFSTGVGVVAEWLNLRD